MLGSHDSRTLRIPEDVCDMLVQIGHVYGEVTQAQPRHQVTEEQSLRFTYAYRYIDCVKSREYTNRIRMQKLYAIATSTLS